MTAIIEWFKALQCIDWVLVVTILLILGVYIYLLVKIPQLPFVGGFIGRRKIRVFGSLIGFLVVFYVFYNLHELQSNEWVEISLLAGLVAATGALAVYAAGQAYASVEMAKEMREQRLSEARPYLLLRLKDRVVQWNNSPDLREHRPLTFPITILNGGKGPAIDLYTALWKKGESRHVYEHKGYLIPGEEWQAEISRTITLEGQKEGWLPELSDIVEQNKTGIIAVECKDIQKRTWVSYMYFEKHPYEDAFAVEGEQNIVEIKGND